MIIPSSKNARSAPHHNCPEITFSDKLDDDSEMQLDIYCDRDYDPFTHINRAQAQQIVDHLTRVFSLEKTA